MRRFTTLLWLTAAAVSICMHPAFAQQSINVEAGQNTILDALAQAQPGDTLVLMTDGGNYDNDNEIVVDMPLVIMAAPGLVNRPVLVNNGTDGTKDIIRLYNDLTLIRIEFNGRDQEGEQTKYGIRTGTGSGDATDNVKKDYVLKILDCYFRDIVHGSDGNAFRAYSGTMADSIIVRNTMVRNMGKQGIRVRDEDSDRHGFGFFNVKYFEVSNSTFSDIKDDAISVYGGDEDPNTPGPEVVINNVTIYNAGHYLLNLRDVENARVTNTIMVNNYDIVNATAKTLGAPWLVDGALLAYSDTLNVSDDGVWTGSRPNPTIDHLYAVDPMFTDPDNGDFTLMSSSPLIGAGENGTTLGDPRWWPEGAPGPATVHMVAAGQNTLMDAVDAAAAGDVIELTDSGGEYLNDDQIAVRVPLTVRAADGLAERPVIKNNEPDESSRVVFRILNSLHLDGVEIDGQAGTDFNAKYLLRIDHLGSDSVKSSAVVKVTDSYLHDVVAGSDGNFLRQYSETLVDSVIFRNSILSGSGKEGIRIKDESSDRPNMGFFNVNHFVVDNTTIANTSRSAIYVYAGDSEAATPEPTFLVNHLTCHNCGHNNGRAIWARGFQNAEVMNSIIANGKEDADWSISLEGDSRIAYSDTFMIAPVRLNGAATAEMMYDIDPEFADPDNLNFALASSSPLVKAGADGLGIGDMRWITTRDAVEEIVPVEFGALLGQNYPNPFREETTIPYRVDRAGHVTLDVYDLLGRRVARLTDEHHTEGDYAVPVVMRRRAAGTYFYMLSVDGQSERRSMVLVR